MTPDPCESYEHLLVEYSDNELTSEDAASLLDHLAACPQCRNLLHRLRRSMAATQTLWGQNLTCEGHKKSATWKMRTSAIVGVAALLVIGAGVLRLNRPVTPTPLTLAQMEQTVEQSGQAARLLALADILARHQAQADLAQKRYHYIVETFPKTPSALIAKTKLQ
ncbi:MAG: zf-HC2 domain-containing protein [Phycisphaeraceae bacterium]|nr:zf-HC2 domain-containing protein [Phycisphaeraceae bacterium]